MLSFEAPDSGLLADGARALLASEHSSSAAHARFHLKNPTEGSSLCRVNYSLSAARFLETRVSQMLRWGFRFKGAKRFRYGTFSSSAWDTALEEVEWFGEDASHGERWRSVGRHVYHQGELPDLR